MDKAPKGPLRRQAYWHAELEEAFETTGSRADYQRAAFAVYYRWIVAESRRHRTGRAKELADHVLETLLEPMEEATKMFIGIDSREDLKGDSAGQSGRGGAGG